jgi:hypothetical protein
MRPPTRVCIYIDGFCRSDLTRHAGAFSEWRRAHVADGPKLIINQKADDTDSLRARWGRLQSLSSWLRKTKAEVHILAYSIGCHLAVRFAVEQLGQPRRGSNIRCLDLLAPDPKFRHNGLDENESSSAYDQVAEFWAPCKQPGECLCTHLLDFSQRSPRAKIHIVYSEDDEVALWERNTRIMKTRCAAEKRIEWSRVAVRTEDSRQKGHFRVKLDLRSACSEFWVHEQLFTRAEWHPE